MIFKIFIFVSKKGINKMKAVAVIPVKLNNERVPGKNIKQFSDGTPLISMIQKACLNAKKVDEVYVFCSDPMICKYKLEGVKYLERPKFLDQQCVNSNDILREFIKCVDADIYIEAHATGPFTKSKSIDSCITAIESGKYDSAFLVKRLQEFLWNKKNPINFDLQHFPRSQDIEPIYMETCGAYAFSKETFLKYDRRVGENPYLHEVSELESCDIDYPDDFIIADAIYSYLNKFSKEEV